MRVRGALEEVGQPYEVRLVPWEKFKEEAHLARNPFGQIPTYEEGDLTLFESGAIVLHSAERFPGLLPKDANARARAIMWMFAALATVEPPIVDRDVVEYFEDGRSWQSERFAMVDERIRGRLNQLAARLGDSEWLGGRHFTPEKSSLNAAARVPSWSAMSTFQPNRRCARCGDGCVGAGWERAPEPTRPKTRRRMDRIPQRHRGLRSWPKQHRTGRP